MSFLKAEWRKLALANYVVNPELLQDYVPGGTELDFWQGKCMVSLVGFMFRNTRLLGVKIPGHIHFEEVNLRFYVKRREQDEWKRGVVFIREIVPRPALTFVANTVYREHYETLPMRHRWESTDAQLGVEYAWKKKGAWHRFGVVARPAAVEMAPGSETEFITEHYWGYARISDSRTNEYQVTHPRWLTYPVLDHTLEVDFGAVYGPDFAFLQEQAPDSVMLAEGSEITVERGRRLKFAV